MYPPNPHYDGFLDGAGDDPEGRYIPSDSDATVDMNLPGPSTGKSRTTRLKCSSPPRDSDSGATVDMNLPGPSSGESRPARFRYSSPTPRRAALVSPTPPPGARKRARRDAVLSAFTLLSACRRQSDEETIDLSSGSSSECSSSGNGLERITFVARTSRGTRTETWWRVVEQADSESEDEVGKTKKKRKKRVKKKRTER